MVDAKAKAQKMCDSIHDGKVVFWKNAQNLWCIVGPTGSLRSSSGITVTKADGSTRKVSLDKIMAEKTVVDSKGRTICFQVATFVDWADARPAAPRAGYTEVTSGTYGRGRRYHAQPGAAVYDDGKTQIWD